MKATIQSPGLSHSSRCPSLGMGITPHARPGNSVGKFSTLPGSGHGAWIWHFYGIFLVLSNRFLVP